MCCLFGFHDYGHNLTRKQRAILLKTLAIACEERGTDATGIAYNENGRLRIYKRPLPAHKMWFRVPQDSTIVMGHTRLTTQGSEKHNQNNHPFRGRIGRKAFALAHNGILSNDRQLRRSYNLPTTHIETDSYVAVQLLEQFGSLDFFSLQRMAEQLDGSFTITALSHNDNLYFIKGNNPVCIYHFKQLGVYVYASTEPILLRALVKLPFLSESPEEIHLSSGDLLCIDARGYLSHSRFNTSKIDIGYPRFHYPMKCCFGYPYEDDLGTKQTHLEDLKAVAAYFGFDEEDIDAMIQDGISLEEIEEYLYHG